MKNIFIFLVLLNLINTTYTFNSNTFDIDKSCENGEIACCLGVCCLATTCAEPLTPTTYVFCTACSNICLNKASKQYLEPQPIYPTSKKECATCLALSCLPCIIPASLFPCNTFYSPERNCNPEFSKALMQGCIASIILPYQNKNRKN